MLLYAGTIGCDFLVKNETPLEIFEKTLASLLQLKRSYNVIIRLHPLVKDDTRKILTTNGFKVAPVDKFLSYLPIVELADVIIGCPTGIVCTSANFIDKPLVVLKPAASWNDTDYSGVAKLNEGLILDHHTCCLLYTSRCV